MTIEQKLADLRDAIQIDINNRGLANLFRAFPEDFAQACRSLAEHPNPSLGVVTGFYIPHARHGETDGPLGAVYLSRTLPALGIQVHLASDPFCRQALEAGLDKCGQICDVAVLDLPSESDKNAPDLFWQAAGSPPPTHLLAIERVGPSHTPESICAQFGATPESLQRFRAEVPQADFGRCHTMRGIDITDHMLDAAAEFDRSRWAGSSLPVTIGIGDGGNEIGMGKIPWDTIRQDIPRGGIISCRVATDHLIVAGISNWGAYALSAGVALIRGFTPPAEWFDLDLERAILECMVEQGPLVDGVSGQFTSSVDGLAFTEYSEPLRRIASIMRA